MKKVRLIVVICAMLMTAAPVVALEVEISGHYFVETFNNSNQTLSDTDATNDYGRMEFMAEPVFKINDNISLTTQFTALQGHVWGQPEGNSVNYNDHTLTSDFEAWDIYPYRTDNPSNLEWKAAYMTLKTSIGGFIIGRYIDTPWGTGLGDNTLSHGKNNYGKDRIMWVVPTGDFISGLVLQRNDEYDQGIEKNDADYHKYYFFSTYKQENWSTGLLLSRYAHKNFLNGRAMRDIQMSYAGYNELADAATTARGIYTGTYAQALQLAAPLGAASLVQAAPYDATASATLDATLGSMGYPGLDLYGLNSAAISAEGAAAAAGASFRENVERRSNLKIWVINSYFMGTFGPISVEAEALYGWGEIEMDETRVWEGKSFDTIDAEAVAATVNLKYNVAGFTFNAGATYVQGDSNFDDDETNSVGYLEQSIDLEHGFLLTSDLSELNFTLGGTDENGIPLGNTAGARTTVTGPAGYASYWGGIKYQVLENLNLGFLYVKSKADDAPKTNAGIEWDDDHGSEYDFTVEWAVMDNLKFKGVVAHLDAGDYWKAGGFNKNVKDNTTLYGRLILEF
ncbi:MAG: hypothetical protein CSA23_00015 [Deltaproteobacteria bacterium]|nr:MAG: hypothetical protein CSA23_00015 [Deltaproteobacteria bacterium]